MKKLFISQPMQGKSKEEILAERKTAICQAKEAVGDEVEIFGERLTLNELATRLDTIPYEILTSVSRRVKRVYFT